jgi:hypothetical protein
MNNPSLTMLLDCSGSMKENGKTFILQQLVRYVRELSVLEEMEQHFESIHFALWFDEVIEESVDDDQPFFDLDVELQVSLGALFVWIQENQPSNILLLSDGYFHEQNSTEMDPTSFNLALQQLESPPLIRCVSVGSDADLDSLQLISSNHVFHSTQIDSAIATPWMTIP